MNDPLIDVLKHPQFREHLSYINSFKCSLLLRTIKDFSSLQFNDIIFYAHGEFIKEIKVNRVFVYDGNIFVADKKEYDNIILYNNETCGFYFHYPLTYLFWKAR